MLFQSIARRKRRETEQHLTDKPSPSISVTVSALLDARLTPLARLVYTLLCSLDQPKQSELALLLGASCRGIQKALACLERSGWLFVVPRCEGRRNWYLLRLDIPRGANATHARRMAAYSALRHREPVPTEPEPPDEHDEAIYENYLRTFCRKNR